MGTASMRSAFGLGFGMAMGLVWQNVSAALPNNVELKPMYNQSKMSVVGEKKIWMEEVPGLLGHFWILDMRGYLYTMYPGGTDFVKKTVINFASKVQYHLNSEYGAFKVVFHPQFIENGKFYIIYMGKPADGTLPADINSWTPSGGICRLEEWTASGAKKDTMVMVREILKYDHPKSYGVSSMVFGKDNFLYVSMGDYHADARDLRTWGRKILRIDIDHKDAGKEYAIPADNPYMSSTDVTVKKEIWAGGFRNAWTMSMDYPTGEIWMGDVGQKEIEEINILKKGRQYGWKEGGDGEATAMGTGFNGYCRNSKEKANCDNYEDPVYAFDWFTWGGEGIKCINGGRVFRGDPTSPFYGYTIANDVSTDRILAVKRGEEPQIIGSVEAISHKLDHAGIVHTATDAYGNLYGVFIGHADYHIYKFTHPEMKANALPVVSVNGKSGHRSNLVVNLGNLAALQGRQAFGLDGRKIASGNGAKLPSVGLFVTK